MYEKTTPNNARKQWYFDIVMNNGILSN